MSITAKPIVNNKLWILQNGTVRVGAVSKQKNGLKISIDNGVTDTVHTLKQIEAKYNIVFEGSAPTTTEHKESNQVYGYDTSSKPYNAVFDVQRQVPLFAKGQKSKSWFAAGYYIVTFPNGTVISFCPKLITLQRYKYSGPFFSKQEAQGAIHEHTAK